MKTSKERLKHSLPAMLLAISAAISLTGCIAVERDHDGYGDHDRDWDRDHDWHGDRDWDHDHWDHDDWDRH